jgi:REP element-mobilizing transposase RayT
MRSRSRQLALDLLEAPGWGGRRAGAGRRPGPRPRDPHRRRAPLAARYPCHVTFRVHQDVPTLRRRRLLAEIERSWREVRERARFRIVHYSVQGNHVHLLVEAASARDLASGLKSVVARFARAVNRVFRRTGQVLADRCHVHVLRTPREVRNAIAYVLLNTRRHLARAGRTLPRRAAIDPASSGRWFDGWARGLPPAARREFAPVAAPRSWLLRLGWRRHGAIDPAEVPGRPFPRNPLPRC